MGGQRRAADQAEFNRILETAGTGDAMLFAVNGVWPHLQAAASQAFELRQTLVDKSIAPTASRDEVVSGLEEIVPIVVDAMTWLHRMVLVARLVRQRPPPKVSLESTDEIREMVGALVEADGLDAAIGQGIAMLHRSCAQTMRCAHALSDAWTQLDAGIPSTMDAFERTADATLVELQEALTRFRVCLQMFRGY